MSDFPFLGNPTPIFNEEQLALALSALVLYFDENPDIWDRLDAEEAQSQSSSSSNPMDNGGDEIDGFSVLSSDTPVSLLQPPPNSPESSLSQQSSEDQAPGDFMFGVLTRPETRRRAINCQEPIVAHSRASQAIRVNNDQVVPVDFNDNRQEQGPSPMQPTEQDPAPTQKRGRKRKVNRSNYDETACFEVHRRRDSSPSPPRGRPRRFSD